MCYIAITIFSAQRLMIHCFHAISFLHQAQASIAKLTHINANPQNLLWMNLYTILHHFTIPAL